MLSIIIPFYNEEENLPTLIKHLIEVCEKNSKEYEIVLVDDGSTDTSVSKLKVKSDPFDKTQGHPERSRMDEKLKVLKHRKRLGKGAALLTGLNHAIGDIIIFMDADLQDDPEDLAKFLKKIEAGFDFVNGVRIGRKDNLIIKTYSTLAKYFLKLFSGSPFTDINCGYKAFKREVLSQFTFYGNNFRFFPLAVFYNGYKVTEIPVRNHPRIHGKSKFGMEKIFAGIFDTLSAYFIYKFSEKPLHFFALIGGFIFTVGFLLSLFLTIERLFFGVLLYQRPILWLGLALIIVGIQIVMTGIIGELIVYLNKKSKET